MPRMTPEQLARYRADYHECRVTVVPLLDHIDAVTAERDRLRALLLAVCGQHPNAVLTDGDTTMTLWHLARRLEEGG